MGSAPTVATYITYEAVFGHTPARAELEALVEQTSLEDWVQTAGKLSAQLANPTNSQAAVDLLVAEGLAGSARARVEQRVLEGQPLVFDTRLGALARVAFMCAERRPPDAFGGGAQGAERLTRALLAVTDVFDRLELPEEDSSLQKDAFSSLLLRRISAKTRAAMLPTLVRYWRLFVDSPRREASLLPPGEDFDQRMQTLAEMNVSRFLALCFGLYTRWMTWNIAKHEAWVVDSSYWSKTTISETEFKKAVGALAADPDQFAHEFAADEAAGFNTIDDLRPLALHPLCEIEPGRVLPLDVEALGPRLLGDGLFWRMKPQKKASRNEKSLYNASVGTLLERHCLEVAQSVYPTGTASSQLFEEIQYGSEHGPDLVVIEDGHTVFIEISAERVNVARTLFRGDVESYAQDIEAIVLDRARRQLDRKIVDARKGFLKFGDIAVDALGTIHPVLCLIDGFPLGPTLRERIDSALDEAGVLQHEDIGRFEIVSVEELEALLGEVERGATLWRLLQAWAQDAELCRWTARDFLIARRGGLALPSLLTRDWEAVKPQLATELFGQPHSS